MPKSRKAPKQVAARAQGAAPSWSSSGAATAWCSAASTCSRARRRRVGDHPGRHRQPAGHEPRHPEGPRGARSRSALGGQRRKLDVGRINGEGFAVMAGAGFDARMIARRRRRPEGPLRAARLRLDRRQEPARRSRSSAKIDVDGEEVVPRQGELRPGRQRRQAVRRRRGVRGRAPDDGVARGRRRHGRRRGRAVDAHARPRGRRRSADASPYARDDDGAHGCGSGSTARCRTSSTAATARTRRSCASTCSRRAIRVCVPGEAVSVAA